MGVFLFCNSAVFGSLYTCIHLYTLQINFCKYPGHHLLLAFGFLMILLKQRILEILFLNHIHPWPPSHSLPCMRSQAGGLHNLQCYYHIWKHDCGLSDVRVNSNIEVWWYSQWIDNEETESTTRIQPTLLLSKTRDKKLKLDPMLINISAHQQSQSTAVATYL